MKVLVITPYFHPHTGGSQRYIEELYSHVQQIDSDIQVDILTYNTDRVAKEESYRGFTVYRLPCVEILKDQFALPNYWSLVQLARKLKANQYDIVNPHTRFFDTSWWGSWLARYLGAKAIFTDHTASAPVHNSPVVTFITRLVDRVALPYLSTQYSQATAVSQATKKYMKKMGYKRPIKVIHGGVDTDFFQQIADSQPEIPKIGPKQADQIVISFVGRMIPAKGADIVLEAVEPLISNSNIKLVFAGDGPLYDKLKSKQTGHIHFLGRISREQVAQLLVNTDIIVHPSTHNEGLPITLLEAGAAGCAVIATDKGGVTEVIQDKKTGFIVKPTVEAVSQATQALVEDTAKRQSLATQLQLLITHQFDWRQIAQNYYKLLKSLK